MQYFDHDTVAGSDDKIIALRVYSGGAAVDCYWTIVERIYRDERPFDCGKVSIAALAQMLGSNVSQVESWIDSIKEVGLLTDGGEGLSSERIDENISRYRAKIEQASAMGKASAAKRKAKRNESSTNVEPTLNGGSTEPQQNKRKENKYLAEQSSAQPNIPCGSGNEGSAATEEYDFSIDMDELRRELQCAK